MLKIVVLLMIVLNQNLVFSAYTKSDCLITNTTSLFDYFKEINNLRLKNNQQPMILDFTTLSWMAAVSCQSKDKNECINDQLTSKSYGLDYEVHFEFTPDEMDNYMFRAKMCEAGSQFYLSQPELSSNKVSYNVCVNKLNSHIKSKLESDYVYNKNFNSNYNDYSYILNSYNKIYTGAAPKNFFESLKVAQIFHFNFYFGERNDYFSSKATSTYFLATEFCRKNPEDIEKNKENFDKVFSQTMFTYVTHLVTKANSYNKTPLPDTLSDPLLDPKDLFLNSQKHNKNFESSCLSQVRSNIIKFSEDFSHDIQSYNLSLKQRIKEKDNKGYYNSFKKLIKKIFYDQEETNTEPIKYYSYSDSTYEFIANELCTY